MATPEEQAQTMIDNLPAKTGRDLAGWLRVVGAEKLDKHGQIVKFLKGEHGVGHGYANLIAHQALQSSALSASGDDLVEAQYAGAKAALRPLYDRLVEIVQRFGDDVELAPKKSYVSVRRKKQFATFQPSTKTRMDVGVQLKGVEIDASERLQEVRGGMVSHKVAVHDAAEIDAELRRWLGAAYAAAG